MDNWKEIHQLDEKNHQLDEKDNWIQQPDEPISIDWIKPKYDNWMKIKFINSAVGWK